jgi:hypothetical protein
MLITRHKTSTRMRKSWVPPAELSVGGRFT